jgi:hypothetical protein
MELGVEYLKGMAEQEGTPEEEPKDAVGFKVDMSEDHSGEESEEEEEEEEDSKKKKVKKK